MTARGFKLVALSVVLAGTALLVSGCNFETVFGLGWPEGITPEDAWVQRLPLPPAYVGHVAVAGARDAEPGVSWRLVGPAAPSG